MKTTMIASTSSAIFHGLFGYWPRMAPVTPFMTHWNLRAPYDYDSSQMGARMCLNVCPDQSASTRRLR